MDQKKSNILWNLLNSVGVVVLIPFCWNYIAVPQIEKIRDDGGYVSEATAKQIIKEIVLEEREQQADNRTASLSWTVSQALGVPREQIAPRITALIKFGEGELAKHQEREQFWQEFTEIRYICPIEIDGKLYFRYTDGDYPISKKDLGEGFYSSFWRHPTDDDKRFIPSISNIKDRQ